jgi:hypothetical protein
MEHNSEINKFIQLNRAPLGILTGMKKIEKILAGEI